MFADPVAGEKFFDRTYILDLLHRRAASLAAGYRQNIAIIGSELIGKTSIIKQFLRGFSADDTFILYLELKDEPFGEFANRFAGTLLYKYLKSHSLRPKETLSELIKQSNRYIPKTVELINSALDCAKSDSNEEGFSKLLDSLSSLKDEAKKCCVIIFDEFHNLERLRLPRPFYVLGNKIMVQKDIMYIISSSSVSLARKIIEEKLSLLFGNFETIEVGPFDLAAAYN